MGFRRNVIGAVAVSLVCVGCAEDPVGTSSKEQTIEGRWAGSVQQKDSSMGEVSFDVELNFARNNELNGTSLCKRIIADTDNDGNPDTLNQAEVTAFYTALGASNPMVFNGTYTTEGNRLIITTQKDDSLESDTTEYSISGNNLKLAFDGIPVDLRRKL